MLEHSSKRRAAQEGPRIPFARWLECVDIRVIEEGLDVSACGLPQVTYATLADEKRSQRRQLSAAIDREVATRAAQLKREGNTSARSRKRVMRSRGGGGGQTAKRSAGGSAITADD